MSSMIPRSFGRRPLRGGVRPLFWDLSDFDRVFGDRWSDAPQAGSFTPHVDVRESQDEYRIVAELPGLAEKDFDVSLEGDVLTLRGQKRAEWQENREGYRHIETTHGSFERRFHLPANVDGAKVSARYENGVLTLVVPKAEAAKPRVIEVEKG